MDKITLIIASLALLTLATMNNGAYARKPISLHPENPRYFSFRNKPTVLITSAEHYGAVLNKKFDYIKYLDEMKRCGFNYTRIFSGCYCENPNEFSLPNNLLAPDEFQLLSPWARSDEPGYNRGGNKFDLSKWDDEYFKRLKSFIKEADKRGIVVEMSLFCTFYNKELWEISPMNSINNINSIGVSDYRDVYTLNHKDLTKLQENMTGKIVSELKDFDNLFYEICNEPYFNGVTLDWQKHIAEIITKTEAGYENIHLIAQNIANKTARAKNIHENISILNFHYAYPPVAITDNAGFKGVIGCDETGFMGPNDSPYREEGWEFILSGGALYNNLDFTFTVDTPAGSGETKLPKTHGGGVTLRKGLTVLKNFVYSFDFIKMAPDNEIKLNTENTNTTIRALSQKGKQYAIYLRGGNQSDLKIDLPAGKYRLDWIDTMSGTKIESTRIEHNGGNYIAKSPEYKIDIALSIKKSK